MKVLLTGATGFVGSHVTDVLLERGIDVAYIARASSNHRWLDGKRAQLVEGSLHDLASLKRAMDGVDAVIHVAGQTAGKNEDDFRRGNEGATQNLIDAALAYRPNLQRFTHISSLAVCGPAVSREQPVTEDMPRKPLTAYGRTKKLAEDVVMGAMDQLPATIVRPPVVYGQRDMATLTFFQTLNKGLSPLIGFDEKALSFVHVRDLARGIVDATLSPKAVGETYFISSDEFYTWPQISNVSAAILGKRRLITLRLPHTLVLGIAGTVGFLGKLGGKPPVLDYEKGIDMTQRYWICSTDKAREHLGYRQNVSLQDGLLETITWYREQEWL